MPWVAIISDSPDVAASFSSPRRHVLGDLKGAPTSSLPVPCSLFPVPTSGTAPPSGRRSRRCAHRHVLRLDEGLVQERADVRPLAAADHGDGADVLYILAALDAAAAEDAVGEVQRERRRRVVQLTVGRRREAPVDAVALLFAGEAASAAAAGLQ